MSQYTNHSFAARNCAVSEAVSSSVNVGVEIGIGNVRGGSSVSASGAILDDIRPNAHA